MWYCEKQPKGLPNSVHDVRLKKGEVTTTTDRGLLTLKGRDKRDVMMLSTYHTNRMVAKSRRSGAAEGGVEEIEKPEVVEEYNQHMGGVDLSELYSTS